VDFNGKYTGQEEVVIKHQILGPIGGLPPYNNYDADRRDLDKYLKQQTYLNTYQVMNPRNKLDDPSFSTLHSSQTSGRPPVQHIPNK